MGRRDEAGRVSRGWAGPGAGADWAGQDACGLWREVGEEGATESGEGEAPRASALLPRLGVVVPQSMMRVGAESQMLSVDFLLPWRLLFAVSPHIDANYSIQLFL